MSEEGIHEGYRESVGQRTLLKTSVLEDGTVCVRNNDCTTMEINQWGILCLRQKNHGREMLFCSTE